MAGVINLRTLFKNHFRNRDISFDELKAFSEDHLARITAGNTGGLFDEILVPTAAAHTAYFGALSNRATAEALREAATAQVDNLFESMVDFIRRKRGAITEAFGEDSPEYQEFYPQGLTEYTNATKADIELIATRYRDAAQRYTTALPGLAAGVTTQLETYQQARAVQLGRKEAVGGGVDSTAAQREAISLRLTANLHYIGFKFPGDEEKGLSYFDQTIIRGGATSEDDGPTPDDGGGSDE